MRRATYNIVRPLGTIAHVGSVSLTALALAGCVSMHQTRLGIGEDPTLIGPAVRDNRTPMDPALVCFGAHFAARHTRPLVIAVGDVRDYTGKYSVNEGNAITQGGALMVTSALGKLGGAIALAERFDPVIAERELGYTDRRQLGDGMAHDVAGPAGHSQVPWLPYYGGSIAASDYYIVGGITELNYDIRSGGLDTEVNQVGPKARTYTQSVAIDLRIVDTRSLLVVKTISLTKQFTGYEVGFNLFRFFGSNLFDINLGAKGEEPLQLGIRTALEEATLRLVGSVTKVEPASCLAQQSWSPVPETASSSPNDHSTLPVPPHGGAPFNASVASETGLTNAGVRLSFDAGRADLPVPALKLVEMIAADAARGPVDVVFLSSDTEASDPQKRDALTERRIGAFLTALKARGIAGTLVKPLWRPDGADGTIHRDGAGLQRIALLRIG